MQQDSSAARPLAGLRVLVTRPIDPADRLSSRLAELGAAVLHHPVIAISDPADWAPVDAALANLDRYDWIVFSSANGVRFLLGRLGPRADRLASRKLAAIGPGTAEELARAGLQAALVPADFRAESLADALLAEAPAARYLLARASRGREVLAERLLTGGARVEQVVVYTSTDVESPDPYIAQDLAAGRIQWVTVTSSAIARNLVRLFGRALECARLASISPITSASLRELGLKPAAEATRYNLEGLVEAIAAASRM